jgi:transcriptional regulator GlxA family with amidase domain
LTHTVGIYLFDDIEVLDFAGPFEIFSTASRVKARLVPDTPKPFEVFTIADTIRTISARGGLLVEPHFDITSHPHIDILIIPGGVIKSEIKREIIIEWIARTASTSTITASVCTGSFLLGQAGLLNGMDATTHWEDLGDLRSMFPDINVLTETRWVDNGHVVTSAGISAGMDMCLHLVARLESEDLAIRTARQMDYQWQNPAK